MSILLKRVVWYRYDDLATPIEITDSVDMNIGRGLDIKNNIATINLMNNAQSFDSSGDKKYEYVNESGEIMFEEQDVVKIYLKYTDDMADVEADEWTQGNATLPHTDYLKGVYYLIEFNVQTNLKGNPIKLKTADKCYVLFSKLLANAFLASDNINAPETIQKVVRFSSQNQDGDYIGTAPDGGAKYDIDARLESVGGHIQDTRKATTENGGVNADTTFPDIAMSKVWKPVYEWINELSQIINLNTTTEIDDPDKIVYGRPFSYYVDEENKFHWFETKNTVAKGNTIVIGTTEGIYNYKLDKKVFDTVNFIIYRGGEDFYGKGTLDYYVDDTSNIKTRRMRVIAMTDIAKKLIQKELPADEGGNGNLTLATDGTFTFSGNRYNRSGTVTPHWSSTAYSTDTTYNNALKTKIYSDGQLRCQSLTKGLAHARYKGSMDRKGSIVTVGSLLNITNKGTGQNGELIRIMDVRDTINKNGWFTQMQIEQDQKAIGASE